MSETPNRKFQFIRSPKHPGAVFFKTANSKKDFVLKLYPEHADKESLFATAPEMLEVLEELSCLPEDDIGGANHRMILDIIQKARGE